MCDPRWRSFLQNAKNKQANLAVPSQRSYGSSATSAEDTANHIWNAMNLMLPSGNEDAVLRIIMDRIVSRLPVPAPTGHNSRHPSESSSEEIPMPQRMLGEPTGSMQVAFHAMEVANPSPPPASSVVNPTPRIRLINPVPEPEPPRQRWTPSERESSDAGDVWLPPAKRAKRRPPQRAATMVDTNAFRMKVERSIMGPLVVRDAADRIENFKCPFCPQLKRRRRDMEAHMECHGGQGANICHKCDFATNSRQLFFWHGKVHEPRQNTVKQHAQRATTVVGLAGFACGDCGEVYAFKSHLTKHRQEKHPSGRGRPRATTRVDF